MVRDASLWTKANKRIFLIKLVMVNIFLDPLGESKVDIFVDPNGESMEDVFVNSMGDSKIDGLMYMRMGIRMDPKMDIFHPLSFFIDPSVSYTGRKNYIRAPMDMGTIGDKSSVTLS